MSDRIHRQRVLSAVADRSGFWSVPRLAKHLEISPASCEKAASTLSVQGLIRTKGIRLHITDDGQIVASRVVTSPSPPPSEQSPPSPPSPPADRAGQFAAAVLSSPGRPRTAYAEILDWDPTETYHPAQEAVDRGLVSPKGIGAQTTYYPPQEAIVSPVPTPQQLADQDAALVSAVTANPHQPREVYREQLGWEDADLLSSIRRCERAGTLVRTGKGRSSPLRPTTPTPAPETEVRSTEDRVDEVAALLRSSDGLTRREMADRLGWTSSTTDRILTLLRRRKRLDHRGTRAPRRFWLRDIQEPAQAEVVALPLDPDDPADSGALAAQEELAEPIPTTAEEFLEVIKPPAPTRSVPTVCGGCGAELRVVLGDGDRVTSVVGWCRPGCLVRTDSHGAPTQQPAPAPPQPETTTDPPEDERGCGDATEQDIRVPILTFQPLPEGALPAARNYAVAMDAWVRQAVDEMLTAAGVPPVPTPPPALKRPPSDAPRSRVEKEAHNRLEAAYDRLAQAELELRLARAEVAALEAAAHL